MDRGLSCISFMKLLGEVGRKSPRSGKCLHVASWFWLVCVVSTVLPNAVRIAENRHGGEAYCVGIFSRVPVAPLWYHTVGTLAVSR